MARSQLDKQGKKVTVLHFFNPKVKIKHYEVLANYKYLPSLFYTITLKKRETATDERAIW